jgi:hypothetical protein
MRTVFNSKPEVRISVNADPNSVPLELSVKRLAGNEM